MFEWLKRKFKKNNKVTPMTGSLLQQSLPLQACIKLDPDNLVDEILRNRDESLEKKIVKEINDARSITVKAPFKDAISKDAIRVNAFLKVEGQKISPAAEYKKSKERIQAEYKKQREERQAEAQKIREAIQLKNIKRIEAVDQAKSIRIVTELSADKTKNDSDEEDYDNSDYSPKHASFRESPSLENFEKTVLAFMRETDNIQNKAKDKPNKEDKNEKRKIKSTDSTVSGSTDNSSMTSDSSLEVLEKHDRCLTTPKSREHLSIPETPCRSGSRKHKI